MVVDRKQEILDVAAELLQTRSFSAFSYQDISDRIGVSKATLHHHFPSKDDLGVALVERLFCLRPEVSWRRFRGNTGNPGTSLTPT